MGLIARRIRSGTKATLCGVFGGSDRCDIDGRKEVSSDAMRDLSLFDLDLEASLVELPHLRLKKNFLSNEN